LRPVALGGAAFVRSGLIPLSGVRSSSPCASEAPFVGSSLALDILKLIGPTPPGEPEKMRERARGIRAEADSLMAFAGHVERTIAELVFEGPAADFMRERLRQVHDDTTGTAHRLQSLAAYLYNAASSTEDAQLLWNRRFGELERVARDTLDVD
jgi:hypothetical protein